MIKGRRPGVHAGGDIRALHDSYRPETLHRVFFEEEYVDLVIRNPQADPGVDERHCDGGGMGIAQGGPQVVVIARRAAGDHRLFPDVTPFGTLPGCLGEPGGDRCHLNAADAMYGAGRCLCAGRALCYHDETLDGMDASTVDSLKAGLASVLAEPGESRLAGLQPAIDDHFAQPDLQAVRDSLRAEQRPQYAEWAQDTLAAMDRLSPLGMAVSLELVRRGRHLSLAEALDLELALDYQWFDGGDIVEGVRGTDRRQGQESPVACGPHRRSDARAYFRLFRRGSALTVLPVLPEYR